jgi:hypothetical protein
MRGFWDSGVCLYAENVKVQLGHVFERLSDITRWESFLIARNESITGPLILGTYLALSNCRCSSPITLAACLLMDEMSGTTGPARF